MPLTTGQVRAEVPCDDRSNEYVDLVGAFLAARCAWRAGPTALTVRKADAGWMPVVGGEDAGECVIGVFTHGVPWSTSVRFDVGARMRGMWR